MQQQSDYPQRRRAVPAWLLSLGVHAALLVVLSFLFAGAHGSLPAPEQLRPVGIVLAKRTAESDAQYFSDASEPIDAVEPEAGANAAAVAASTAAAADLDSLAVSEFALPSAADVSLAGVTAVDRPSLTVAGGRTKLPGVDESEIIAQAQARLKAANARGPTARLGIFGSREPVGNSFVFLIDRSKSMGGNGLGVLQDAAKELVRALKPLTPEQRFQVIVYHDKCVYLNQRRLLPATPENKDAVPDFLGGKAAFGATEHARALMSALRLEPDVIFLLTDGGEPALTDQQIRSLAKLAGDRTSIHCLQFGSGPLQDPNNFLKRLADQTHGEYGYIDVRDRR